MRQTIFIFSAIAAALLILLSLRRLSLFSAGGHEGVWTAVFAAAFIVIGVVLHRVMHRRSTPPRDSEMQPDPQGLDKLGITPREYEVLKLVAQGLSNQEISDALFISESTVKSHVSNLLVKLDARRRTQAVQRAKQLRIL